MKDLLDRYLSPLLWTVGLLLATWGAWALVTGREVIPSETPVKNEPATGEIPPAVVDEPIVEETSADGTVQWTLYLDRIVRTQGSVTELARPRAVYRMQSGEVLEVTSDSGTYDENTGLLSLAGNVNGHARNSQFGFSVSRMTWSGRDSVLTASGGVTVTRDGIGFKGQDLKLNLSQGLAHIEVTGGVEVTGASQILQQLGSSPR
jgi:LPS export ABC transporter protein LptC